MERDSPHLISMEQDLLRPVTLIFAKEATPEGVKEALLARRTAIFADGCVYGDEALLNKLVSACLKVKDITKNKDFRQDYH